MSLSPDLKVLCRKLTAATPAELPALCPVLVAHVLRCSEPLSVSSEQQGKAKNKTSETAVLVHKLKTQVKTLLQGKTAQGRFAGTVLAKAIIDVGGWECLRTAEPWVRALLAILQKASDPLASKELALITLTRIYTLLQPYPTLVREFATPTITTFATACLQLVRASSAEKKVPMRVVETATRALAALVPLYPTTLRPFAAQTRVAIRGFIAPTSADGMVVPLSLRRSARQLLVLLHYTAAKNSNADEWRRALDGLIRDAHRTADQVFRAVREARDPSASYEPGPVSYEGEPAGGGSGGDGTDDNSNLNPEGLPAWSDLQSGAERLAGLLETIAEFFHCSSKLPVVVPIGVITSLVSRVSVVLPPSTTDSVHDRDAMLNAAAALINPNIGRDEREEMWALLPGIHAAALDLLASMVTRMGAHMVPLVPEILEQAVRMFAANCLVPRVRATTFALVRDTLPLIGPSLSKPTVAGLMGVVRTCCQDILESTGHLAKPPRAIAEDSKTPAANGANGANSRGGSKMTITANADLFLKPGLAANGTTQQPEPADKLARAHLDAAETLLTAVLSYVPQQHIKKADRALLDRTAILSANKDAMVASVLQPYVDSSGRYFANTVPFLARAYPHDIEMEVLRSNLRTVPHYFGNIFSNTIPGEDDEGEEDDDDDDNEDTKDNDVPMLEADGVGAAANGDAAPAAAGSKGGFALPAVFTDRSKPAAGDGPSAAAAPAPAFQPLTLKRKSDEKEPAADSATKRLDTGKAPAAAAAAAADPAEAGDDSGDESDGSVQLEMVFDVDDESGDENEA